MKTIWLNFLLSLSLTNCTGVHHETLKWRSLSSDQLLDLKVDENRLGDGVYALQGTAGRSHLKIIERQLKEPRADDLWKSTTSTLHSYFQDSPAPYPGFVTRQASCPEKYKPKALDKNLKKNSWQEGLLLNSTDRFTFGACSQEQVAYRVLVANVYCKQKELNYEIRLFEPVTAGSRLKEIYVALHCL